MANENRQLKGFPLMFNLYAYDEQEAEDARKAIIAFIDHHAKEGRAVTARKVEQAVRNWDKNPIVKNQIIKYFT